MTDSSPPEPTPHETLDSYESVATAPAVPRAETTPTKAPPRPVRQRRVLLPIVLFIATCLSTFFVGWTRWQPTMLMGGMVDAEYDPLLSDPLVEGIRLVQRNVSVSDGLIYMACLLAILFAHEMGHFLMTVRYRIHASFPYFIPIPISPIGTMGAVIGMDGLKANRKQLFDIGLAGPLAGLVIAVPVLYVGIGQLDLTKTAPSSYSLDIPLGLAMAMSWFQVPGYSFGDPVAQAQLNPYFMAGWVGLLVTGLNMLPISQLDGGHVAYTLFGKWSYYLAWGVIITAVTAMTLGAGWTWILMLILVLLIGPAHPPTSDDTVPIGPLRWTIGFLSLVIPILCFPPQAIIT
ncbi:site-2 protease family protein [Blastopirellula sp. JC732]|uniref:Site-2 protease family protein n=1 Tax=Blastopirellula sediminis TaxID=2894196 RepID=A0A9X1MLX0_9BACT|nr:site-2 protease family protein [Blastopirellula sediminis]MCC9607466.1 site-2 protease family protein [Blastopirellula sediminis]MCC9629241.1 site-2 protease family protein [Blastopirellula sediminis]